MWMPGACTSGRNEWDRNTANQRRIPSPTATMKLPLFLVALIAVGENIVIPRPRTDSRCKNFWNAVYAYNSLSLGERVGNNIPYIITDGRLVWTWSKGPMRPEQRHRGHWEAMERSVAIRCIVTEWSVVAPHFNPLISGYLLRSPNYGLINKILIGAVIWGARKFTI